MSQRYGFRNKAFLESLGIQYKIVPASQKHRFIYPLRDGLKDKLTVPVIPYPAMTHEVSKWKKQKP